MGTSIPLKAMLRGKENGKPKSIRTQGQIPAVLYGKKTESKSIKIDTAEFEKVYSQAGESTLLDLAIDADKPVKVLVYAVQRDPVKGRILSVDFYKVDMKEKITTEIPLNFIGESKAVNEMKGVLVKSFDEIEVECLPADLVQSIDVDISVLDDFDKQIKVSDINFPEGMEPQIDFESVVASVQEPAVEEEAPAAEEEAAAEAEGEEGEKTDAEGEKENGGEKE